LVTALLASCSASKSVFPTEPQYDYASNAGKDEEIAEGGYGGAPAATATTSDQAGTGLTGGNTSASLSAEKIIYSYSATVETTKFDETLGTLNTMLGQYGAFIETSYVSGSKYGYDSFRSASYVIRVPVKNFAALTGGLDTLGNVYNENTTSENITAQFTDTESRLNTYRTEESRLLSMLDKADTVEDMITIEARLSDVRYQIESLTSMLRNWQNEVDYSTVTLYINEVEELTDQLPTQRTYWEKIGDGFTATLKGIGDFFKAFLMVIIVASPVLLILAVIAVVVIVLIRKSTRKKKTPPPPPPPVNPQ
jgi:hypothetical protein